ncbi:hypothetical protein MMC14_010156 [Varicellaria rhodocarpa]|nr:hypothetical protein [Varicellaria rhodocarpa]
MPLEPYHYRPITPPSPESRISDSITHRRKISASSFWSLDSSPESIETSVTTPSRSPIRQHGPTLLPKIRAQDQSISPAITPTFSGSKAHRRALSNTINPPGQPRSSRPSVMRSTTSPPECISLVSPTVSNPTFNSAANNAVNSSITLTPSIHRRGSGHSRSASVSGVDDATLRKFGFPYHRVPSYLSGAQWGPSVIPGSSTFIAPPAPRPQAQTYHDVAEELIFQSADESASTLNEYLTGPNPAINLVQQVNTVLGRGLHSHFWWDIRNLHTWEGFNLETIHAVPDFSKLLEACIRGQSLMPPVIAPYRLRPDSEVALHEVCRDFFVTKVNAAMKVTLGHNNYISMRAEKSRDGPQFVSNYQNDIAKTLAGNGRGRVVGIVKSYERWNTGMRGEAPHRRVIYLEGLSHLHRYMREHECRYGFIMTEIELVCVRAGTDSTPYFGHLELAPTIAMSTQEGLTACMALWFLHMLAKDQPLPGQCGWRLDVGAPAAMTRMHVMEEKDSWIPDPQMGEKRDAKRVRGWVMPTDPWHKKKEGKKVWNK